MIVVDLYHIYSHPMFYNENTKKVIQGDAAMNMHRQRKQHVGFREFKEADKVVIGEHTITAYGRIYEV